MRPEDGVRDVKRTTACGARSRCEHRVDVLPHDLFIWRHFEESPSGTFANQGVPIREALCTANHWTVEGERRFSTVLPDDLVGCGVDRDYARVGYALSTPVRTIVKEQHAPSGQGGRIVLVGDVSWPPLPAKVPGGTVDDANHADLAKTHKQVPGRRHIDGVAVRPLVAG